MKNKEFTQEYLKSALDYNKDTGIFTWAKQHGKKIKVGNVAGYTRPDKYISIRVDLKNYLAHRLAWFYIHGIWPEHQIDHIDSIRNHNWIDNLREATNQENTHNLKKAYCNNITGLLGVKFDRRRNTYSSRIMKSGIEFYLGYFNTAEEAHERYLEEKRKIHPFNTI